MTETNTEQVHVLKDTHNRRVRLSSDSINWLIEQAEIAKHFAKKNAQLNEFLQKHNETKHLGRNVIDVAMDIITKQAERVQELEIDLNICQMTKLGMESIDKFTNQIKDENRRLREALEYYADKNNYRYKGPYPSNIESDEGYEARQALKE